MADERLGISVNLKNFAHTQYQGFDFNSMVEFAGRYVGAHPSKGLCVLFEDGMDDEEDINAFFELKATDFGIKNPKRFRKLQFGYESTGYLLLTPIINDKTVSDPIYLQPTRGDNEQQNAVLPMKRNWVGRYWTFRIDNSEGCDFSVDAISGSMIILQSTRRKISEDIVVLFSYMELPDLTLTGTATVV